MQVAENSLAVGGVNRRFCSAQQADRQLLVTCLLTGLSRTPAPTGYASDIHLQQLYFEDWAAGSAETDLAEDHLNCMMDREALPGNCSFRGMRGQRKSKQKRIEPPSFFHIFHLFYDDVIYELQNNTTQCHLEALDGNESGRRGCPANLESLD